MRLWDMNWHQVEQRLTVDDRVVVPLGSTEQHGWLSLGTDAILAERVAVEAAKPLGIPVLPVLPIGMAPYFAAFPGSLSLRPATDLAVLTDLLDTLWDTGFRRIALVNGHGGNAPALAAVRQWSAHPGHDDARVQLHSWYSGPAVTAVADGIEAGASHGGWFENFPWTRLEHVELPADGKPLVSAAEVAQSSPSRLRALIGDGSFGGSYAVSDEQMAAVWAAGVAEVRTLLESGWAQ